MIRILVGAVFVSEVVVPALAEPLNPRVVDYQLAAWSPEVLRRSFTASQLALLEKLNRADTNHLARQPMLVIPSRWDLDELAYSPLPAHSPALADEEQLLFVHLPSQVFGAYEHGRLVRWGPISSGRETSPTPDGTYHLNWRSRGRHSTVDPDWFMKWYFTSKTGEVCPFMPTRFLAVRPVTRACACSPAMRAGYTTGVPAGHSTRRAPPSSDRERRSIVGAYDFDAPPPWRSPAGGA